MFDNLGWWEIITLVLIGLFVFGPERLPKLVRDAARVLRQVRSMARNATSDLREEIGTDLDLADLNPKVFVRKHLLSEEDEQDFRKPFTSAFDDLRGVATEDEKADRTKADRSKADRTKAASNGSISLDKDGEGSPSEGKPSMSKQPPNKAADQPATRYDLDAT